MRILAEALIHANKALPVNGNGRGRPSKRKSIETIGELMEKGCKNAIIRTPCDNMRYDQLGHWPEPTSDKSRCRLCQSYVRIVCSKCKVSLSKLLQRFPCEIN